MDLKIAPFRSDPLSFVCLPPSAFLAFRDSAIKAFPGLIAEAGNRGSAEEQKH
jgi:hypothetical protein